ncbi:hypothetical protein HanIR_Chr17g0887091 [Helianthus annuus]|nr:hypothetical protein HanIR_Chr17g0887091 [Helianthus annuus]
MPAGGCDRMNTSQLPLWDPLGSSLLVFLLDILLNYYTYNNPCQDNDNNN